MSENYYGITDKGRQRQNNEDTFIADTILNNRFIAAGVIDGVGGYDGGEVAAQIARQVLSDHFKKSSPGPIGMLRQALLSANQKILEEKQKVAVNNKMACVLTVILVENKANKFYYAHVGDTRLYLFRDNSLVKITLDHSFVGMLEDSGRLDEEAAMSHPKRNEINKALGFEAPIVNAAEYFQTGESPFLPGDLLLLCSDGLTDMINKTAITNILSLNKNLQEKGKALIDAANNAGGKDNITVVLVQNNYTPVTHAPTKQARTKTSKTPYKTGEEIQKRSVDIPSQKNRSRNHGVIFFLALLTILSTTAFLWQYLKKEKPGNFSNSTKAVTGSNTVYDQSFQDTINNFQGTQLFLTGSSFGRNIYLQDTVFINKDSIHITGGINTTITTDTLLKRSVPIVISPSVNYLLFENLHLKNTDIIIHAVNMEVIHLEIYSTRLNLRITNKIRNIPDSIWRHAKLLVRPIRQRLVNRHNPAKMSHPHSVQPFRALIKEATVIMPIHRRPRRNQRCDLRDEERSPVRMQDLDLMSLDEGRQVPQCLRVKSPFCWRLIRPTSGAIESAKGPSARVLHKYGVYCVRGSRLARSQLHVRRRRHSTCLLPVRRQSDVLIRR